MDNYQELIERRKIVMTDMLTPYVSQDASPARTQDQYKRIGKIVEGCRNLERSPDGRSWLPEFYGGTPISSACDTAWEIHCLTKETVQFMFNGVEIRMEDPLP